MARGRIKTDCPLEYLSILDERGNLDETLEPEIDADKLRRMYGTMLLARRFDERLLSLQRQGRLGTFAPVKGQEAAQVGAAATLGSLDWVVPSYRETAVQHWRGADMADLFVFFGGYNEGSAVPAGSNDVPPAVPVGSQMLHAAGIGYAIKHKAADGIVMTFFGDGATSEGDFHEAMNFASVFQTPTVFVCQNNQYAISLPRSRQSHSETIAQKAVAYGMPGLVVDGNDLLAVHSGVMEAVTRARESGGPTLIECVTYRLEVHTTADDPTRYRDDDEVERWQDRDPLPRMRNYLLSKGLLEQSDVDDMEGEVESKIKAAWKEAQERMQALDDPAAMFDHVYGEMPAHLDAQRDRLRNHLGAADAEREETGA